ncbi:hypothetical protein ACTFIW_008674 [Dictyostelium discoideum]
MHLKLEDESGLREAQAALFNINSTNGWCLLNYSGQDSIYLAAKGENFDEIVGNLKDDQIQYGVVRIGDIQEKGTLKTTVRDVFFCWIGPGVGIIQKVLNKSNFTRENVIDRSNPLSGSHVIE